MAEPLSTCPSKTIVDGIPLQCTLLSPHTIHANGDARWVDTWKWKYSIGPGVSKRCESQLKLVSLAGLETGETFQCVMIDGHTGLHQNDGYSWLRESQPTINERLLQESTIDHPAHYGGADNPFEAIKVIEAWKLNFALGNAVKYISRAGKKDGVSDVEDLKKAAWYLNRELARRTAT